MAQITEQIIIGELVEQHPEVIDTLLNYGVHCIGCQANPYESLGDGFRGHGMSEEDIAQAVSSINKVITEHVPEEQTQDAELYLDLTPLAFTKIKEFCTTKNKQALRIGIKRGGCSGYSYFFELIDSINADDIVIEDQGIRVVVDKGSVPKLTGSQIDYQDSLMGAGFKVSNPLATKSCGCGSSVGF